AAAPGAIADADQSAAGGAWLPRTHGHQSSGAAGFEAAVRQLEADEIDRALEQPGERFFLLGRRLCPLGAEVVPKLLEIGELEVGRHRGCSGNGRVRIR